MPRAHTFRQTSESLQSTHKEEKSMNISIYNTQNKYTVIVTNKLGAILKKEFHYFQEDADTAAKYLSVEFKAPITRKFE